MTVRNLEFLFSPRTVALIGASPQPGSIGRIIARNLDSSTFAGEVFLVNPHHTEIDGTVCYPSVSALPRTPDLAIVATPPRQSPRSWPSLPPREHAPPSS